MSSRRRLVAALSLGALASLPVASCIGESDEITEACPPYDAFKQVSPVLEQRCGTLDCHGQPGRPMRIFGSIGLRAADADEVDNPNYYPGGSEPTTEKELTLNYRSVCGLEPELMADVIAGKAKPEELTLVRKPRNSEKHKGGKIWDQGKPGDRCLVAWLQPATYPNGLFDASDCIVEVSQ